MSLIAKLKGGSLALTLAAAVLAIVSMVAMRGLKDTLNKVVQGDVRKVELAGRIEYSSADLLRLENAIIFRLMSQDAPGSELCKRNSGRTLSELTAELAELRPLETGSAVVAGVDSMEAVVKDWSQAHGELLKALDSQQYDVAQKTLSDRITPAGERMTALAGKYASSVQTGLEQARADAENREQTSMTLIVIFGLISVGMSGAVQLIVRGASATLRGVVGATSNQAEQVAASAAQVSSAAQSLATAASEQAASLEETSASGEEVSAMSRRVAENMSAAAARMSKTDQAAHSVRGALDEMIQSMQGISRSSEKISKIIGVIDELAFQTNILSLNASIEAARAGKAGLGFAVVADQVRALAHRSAEAARDTATLIEESIGWAREGNVKVDTVNLSVREITGHSAEVKKLIDEVNAGVQEQAHGIRQIADAMERMQKVTMENAAVAQQSSAAGAEMSAQSGAMKQTARELAELIGGRG